MRLTRIPLPILLLLLQFPLILNPGYFSHDELQWLARADAPSWSSQPWIAWFDFSPLQYRPLTFNLWLVLARTFGATPELMHLVFVAIGTANACLLARVLVAARITERTAYVSAVVFCATPYVVYVHGWTATLADLLTLALGLLAARMLQNAASAVNSQATAAYAAATTLLVAIALLGKESAIVLPALLPLAVLRENPPRRWLPLVAPSAAIVVAYLAIRLPILAASANIDNAYAWSPAHMPARLTEYLLFPFMPPLLEIAPLLDKSVARIAAAAGCVALVLGALASIGWRWPLAWLIAFAAALAPVLVLATSYDHYGYLASAVAIAICAAAWPKLGLASRAALAFAAAVAILHGATIVSRTHRIGITQQNLYADLTENLSSTSAPLHIAAADPRDTWLLGRLLRGVETYRGMPFAERLRFGDAMPAQPADRLLWMNRDGHLRPDAAPLTPH